MKTQLISIDNNLYIDYHKDMILTPKMCNSTLFRGTSIDPNSDTPLHKLVGKDIIIIKSLDRRTREFNELRAKYSTFTAQILLK